MWYSPSLHFSLYYNSYVNVPYSIINFRVHYVIFFLHLTLIPFCYHQVVPAHTSSSALQAWHRSVNGMFTRLILFYIK